MYVCVCVCVCVCVYIYTYIYFHMHIDICMNIFNPYIFFLQDTVCEYFQHTVQTTIKKY
jgi:hypothetical protein